MKIFGTLTLLMIAFTLGCKDESAPQPPVSSDPNTPPPILPQTATTQEPVASTAPVAKGSDVVATFNVEGMTCNNCVQAIQRAVAAVPNVKSARVSLEEKKAWVVSEAPIDDVLIVQAIKAINYNATPAAE